MNPTIKYIIVKAFLEHSVEIDNNRVAINGRIIPKRWSRELEEAIINCHGTKGVELFTNVLIDSIKDDLNIDN